MSIEGAPRQPQVRQYNFFREIARDFCAFEDGGACQKVIAIAIYLLALIGSFISIIGIPFFIWIDHEVVLLRFEQRLHQERLIVTPLERATIDQVADRTNERDVEMARAARLTQANQAQGGEIARLQAENQRLTQLSREQAEKLNEVDVDLKALISNSLQELGSRASEERALQGLAQDVAALHETFRQREEELLKIPEELANEYRQLFQKALKMEGQLRTIRNKLVSFADRAPDEQAKIARDAAVTAITSPVKDPLTFS